MKYVFVGSHPETLASGRPLVFGDPIDASELSHQDAYLAPLLVESVVPPAPTAPKVVALEALAPEPTNSEAK